MIETVAKFDGVSEYILEKLVGMGYYRTRTEALRAGILELGKEYKLLGTPQEIEDELAVRKMQIVEREIASGKRKLIPFKDVLKKAGIRREDL